MMTLIAMAQRYRTRPSELLYLDDPYAAYCLDEVCCWISQQLEEGKRPFFRDADEFHSVGSGNQYAIQQFKNLGAEVKNFD